MQWLISQIWIALAVASVLGLWLGMAVRGLMIKNRLRRAEVERDITKTELDQTRVELDELYLAQRKRMAEDPNIALVTEKEGLALQLAERDAALGGLQSDLTGSRSSLETLHAETGQLKAQVAELEAQKGQLDGRIAELQAEAEKSAKAGSNVFGQAGSALAGAAIGAAVSDDSGQVKDLEDRNTWLEGRVAALETDLSKANSPLSLVEPEPENEPETELADEVEKTASEGDEELARLRWRNRYLEQRLAYHEGDPAVAAEDQTATETTRDDKTGLLVGGAALAGAAASLLTSDQQEAQAEPETSAEPEPEPEVVEVIEVAAAEPEVVETVEAVTPEPAPEPAPALQPVTRFEPETAREVEIVPEPEVEHPSDAILKALEETEAADEAEPIQPPQADAPKDGGGDDLTEISGIGPKIADLLNELGVWNYAQIAAWTPENAVWVEQHLSFKGRVGRENWIAQAVKLAA